ILVVSVLVSGTLWWLRDNAPPSAPKSMIDVPTATPSTQPPPLKPRAPISSPKEVKPHSVEPTLTLDKHAQVMV
ncbi:hypothetical protein, partial [uncultured Vibrio sp.]|uniref:hypothetical protein n=1 Tax=uncultured Vibrio sp. TaxID=114054 RepID=UPI00260E13F8